MAKRITGKMQLQNCFELIDLKVIAHFLKLFLPECQKQHVIDFH